METLLAFTAALLSFRLAGGLAGRWRARRAPELAAWACALLAYALASAALAWGSAHGWDGRAFRVYYLFGGLLTVPWLAAGSLLLVGRRWAAPAALLWTGLAIGVMVAVPLHGSYAGTGIPTAQAHLAFLPARILAVLGNSVGTVVVVVVALLGFRRRPIGNTLILAGVAVAAVGSALAGLGEAATSLFIAAAALLLYLGFVAPGPSGDRRVASEGSASLTG